MKASNTADSMFDLETIVFNETVMFVVRAIRDSFPLNKGNIKIFQSRFIYDTFSEILESLNKEELFSCVSGAVTRQLPKFDLKVRQTFLKKTRKDFENWLGYRSTYFTLCNHVSKVYGCNIVDLFELSLQMKKVMFP
jgi:hypothetical protein